MLIKMKDLDYANGWKEIPEIVKNCPGGKEHRIEGKSLGRCLSQTTCHTCGYTYKVDSSG